MNVSFYGQKNRPVKKKLAGCDPSSSFFKRGQRDASNAIGQPAAILTNGVAKWVADMPAKRPPKPACVSPLGTYSAGCQLFLWSGSFLPTQTSRPLGPSSASNSVSCIQNQQGASDWWQPFQSLVLGPSFSSDWQAPSQQPLVPFPKL